MIDEMENYTFCMDMNDNFHYAGNIFENPDLLRIGDDDKIEQEEK